MVELEKPGSLPWLPAAPVETGLFAEIRARAIFECCKWDPQVEDVPALSPVPLVLRRSAWDELARLSERLAAEAAEAEEELMRRPELHRELGLPRAVRRALAGARRQGPTRGVARVLRFDFHWTEDGWRISEANSDVPGGFVEGSGFARLMAPRVPGAELPGDPAAALAEALADATPPGSTIGLVHATAYTDDRQVMVFLAREIEACGRRAEPLAPDHLRWRDGLARAECSWLEADLGAIVRFFPGEWLPALRRSCGWPCFFAGGRTPVSNPGAGLLVQSKRFPLVWDRLKTELSTWRRLLPETRDPRAAPWRADEEGWVLKPALGRVGDGVGVAGATPEREWRTLRKQARWRPGGWAAQRRFAAVPLRVEGSDLYPCIGVFTVDGRAAGAYGRLARRARIDHLAQDVAVLVEQDGNGPEEERDGSTAAL
jgi:hypothetical protein